MRTQRCTPEVDGGIVAMSLHAPGQEPCRESVTSADRFYHLDAERGDVGGSSIAPVHRCAVGVTPEDHSIQVWQAAE